METMDVNNSGEKVGLEPILLSKLSAIKKTNFKEYITKKFAKICLSHSKCKTLKCLLDAHVIKIKSYYAHQLNYFKYVNMQNTHCNEYYTNVVFHSLGYWRSLRSSMTKWTVPKQPHHVLGIKSKPHMVFLSFLVFITCNMIISNVLKIVCCLVFQDSNNLLVCQAFGSISIIDVDSLLKNDSLGCFCKDDCTWTW